MASLQHLLLLSLLFHTIFVIKCDDVDEEDTLFQGINQYRASLKLSSLTKNERAECLASEIADQFKGQPCTNSTGANTVPGTEPQYKDFPNLLRKCQLNVTTTRDGQIMPACVPNLDPALVLSNFTKSQYSGYLNDTEYSGVGIGTEDDWIVVVVTTNTPEGGYSVGTNTNNSRAAGASDKDDDKDDNKDDDIDDGIDDIDDGIDDDNLIDEDEEEDLFRGINRYRTSLKLSTLTKNERAECLAEEIADQFKSQPCTIALRGADHQYKNFPNILRKCNLNLTTIKAGQIMPVCVPDMDSKPSLVLSNFTQSPYAGYLNDTQFVGIGIGSEDDWIVAVVTTSATPSGRRYSIGANSNVNGAIKAAGFCSYTVFLFVGVLVFLL